MCGHLRFKISLIFANFTTDQTFHNDLTLCDRYFLGVDIEIRASFSLIQKYAENF